jgi:hypothetical protein
VNLYGVGIDFETNTSLSLSTADDSTVYDIRVRTIKGLLEDGTTYQGCPHIKLYKQTVTAYQYSGGTGKTTFDTITKSTVDTSLFAADSVEEIDTDDVTNTNGDYVYSLLYSYYESNLVTKKPAPGFPLIGRWMNLSLSL